MLRSDSEIHSDVILLVLMKQHLSIHPKSPFGTQMQASPPTPSADTAKTNKLIEPELHAACAFVSPSAG